MIRAVLDSNVFVSAAIQRGPSYRLVQAWLESRVFELIVSDAILAEVTDVLARPRLAKRISPSDAEVFVHAIRVAADVADDPRTVVPLTRDPDDDYLIALAREQHADLIVSGDDDLLSWIEQVPRVVTPAVFDAMLRDH